MSRRVAVVLPGLVLLACAPEPPAPESPQGSWFRDVTAELGIDFAHRDGRSGHYYYVETAASGGGWLDADGDGDLDLYLVNGGPTPGSELASTPRNTLYENRAGADGEAGFVDVTTAAGVGDPGYGMGLCAGDVDADGRLDFLVTNYGADRLYRNLGQGTDGVVRFEEISGSAGVAGERWGTNCAFADVDGDGDLDLYVANYVDFRFDDNPRCENRTLGIRSYCRPAMFDGQADYLYINQSGGGDAAAGGGAIRFTEEGRLRGIDQGPEEKGFGVVFSDLDDDGDADLLVANDGTPNRLYVNDGRGFFHDRSLASGMALNRDGHVESSMGLDLGDADGDGRLDLMVTNYSLETNTLYLHRGGLFFEDRTAEAGLAADSYRPVGWGVRFFDADNDGDLDLAVVNGHVMDNIHLFESGIGYPQPNLLFENDGGGSFRNVSERAGPAFAKAKVSRGLATADWNDDGRLDLLITNTNDGVDLLENTLENANHWIGFALRGAAANPSAIGARLVLSRDGKILGVSEVQSGGSFLGQSDLRLHFGLGGDPRPVEAEVRWPDGSVQHQGFDSVDRYWAIDYRRRRGSSTSSAESSSPGSQGERQGTLR